MAGPPSTASLVRLLDALIPASLAGTEPTRRAECAEKQRRARIVVACHGIAIFATATGTVVAMVLHQPGGAVAAALACTAWIACLLLLRLSGSLSLASHAFTAVVYGFLVVQSSLIWTEPLALCFLAAVPIAAALTCGARSSAAWTIIAAVSTWPLAWLASDPVASSGPFGDWRVVAWTAFIMTLALGTAFGLIESLRARAVSDALAASSREQAEHRRFQAVAEQSYQTIGDLLPDGTLNYVSPNVRDALGWTAEELVGRSPDPLIHPEDLGPVQRALGEGERGPFRTELRLRHRSGAWVWNELVAGRYAAPDGSARWILAARDVTKERAERERLQDNQRLESIGVLAGGIAHDFNNLLMVIRGAAEELGDEPGTADIRQAVERASALTTQLLAVGRKQMLRPRPLSINELIEGSLGMVESLLRGQAVVALDLDPDLWQVVADASQLERVILNLTTNACQAMTRPGRFRLSTRNVSLGGARARELAVPPGDYVCLRVSDDGAGMDEETRERAFDPFYTTRGLGHGTGLGLASVYGIVEQSHGGIELRSSRGAGTSIDIVLPRARSAANRDVPRAAPAEGYEALVWVVDDEEVVRRLLTRSLERAGFQVLAFPDGRDALDRVSTGGLPDALVTDVVMPGVRGPELARALREQAPRLPVLFVSGYDDQELGAAACEDGASFLPKPFGSEQLVDALRTLLETPGTSPD